MITGELSSWFKGRPTWVQEAAKKLLEKDSLVDQDVKDLAELCLKEAVGTAGVSGYIFPDDTFKSGTSDSLRLCSIGEIQNINALAPRNPLCFGDGNLSVVYGQTGSGKSGYVRILKHACGARHPDELHSNIYASEPSPQQCSISYDKGGAVISRQWVANSTVIEDLCSVHVFDASCGRVYIAAENEVTYEPPVLTFFSALISVCETVSSVIDSEISKLPSQKPTIPPDYASTASGKWYAALSKDITVDDIDKHCEWADVSETELSELEKRLSEQAPSDKAKQLRTRKTHADGLIQDTEDLFQKLSDENCKRILAAKKQWLLKQEAARFAAEQAFEDAPLEGVGSEVWKLLWENARKYSQEQAYKGQAFPYVGDSARCLLCQQPLSDEATKRVQSFEKFVRGEMQKGAEAAQRTFEQEIKDIGDLPSTESTKTKADAAGLGQEELQSVEETYSVLRMRKGQLITTDSVESLPSVPQDSKWIDRTRSLSAGYDNSAQRYEDDAKGENREGLISGRLELQAKKWVSAQRKSIDDEIARLEQLDVLSNAKRLTDTKGLSRKKGELADALITDAFISRFDGELKKLGAGRINIELTKTRVEKGRVLHRLRLSGTSKGSPEDILSEGEHRIVALAAFLADVGEKQNAAPFVFDDPISSLDQDFEEAVVQRLVDLSKERQIIVFTHRLSLLGLIQDYAKKCACEPNVICVRQEAWGTGEPGDTPLFAKKPEKALNTLLNDNLPKARKLLTDTGAEAYTPFAKSICSEYRILLERMIECDLLADVVQRYRRAVNTMGKLDKLARITDADCKFFNDMMTKYSRYEHSQPGETPVALPAPDELQRDMEALRNWRNEFLKRGSQ